MSIIGLMVIIGLALVLGICAGRSLGEHDYARRLRWHARYRGVGTLAELEACIRDDEKARRA